MIGIYTIENILNKKLYIGYSINVKRRLGAHRNALLGNYHSNRHLQGAFNLSGDKNFKFEILEECEERFLCSQEHYWCNLLRVHEDEFGYNINPTHPYNNGRGKGYKHSEQSRKKIGEALKNRNKIFPSKVKGKKLNLSEEQRSSRKMKHTGLKHKKETILKMKEKGKLRVYPDYVKDKLREFNKINSQKARKPVSQYLLDGHTLVSEFSSLKEANENTGISTSSISSCLKGRCKSARKYIWKYKNK